MNLPRPNPNFRAAPLTLLQALLTVQTQLRLAIGRFNPPEDLRVGLDQAESELAGVIKEIARLELEAITEVAPKRTCAILMCDAPVPAPLIICQEHWNMLPNTLQLRILSLLIRQSVALPVTPEEFCQLITEAADAVVLAPTRTKT